MKSELAMRLNEWLESVDGKQCCNPRSIRECSEADAEKYLRNRIESAFLAGADQAAPQTPFDTCPTCEALARAVMMDQTGAA